MANLPAKPETQPSPRGRPRRRSRGRPARQGCCVHRLHLPGLQAVRETPTTRPSPACATKAKISLEYRPLGFLDRQSSTNYSSRAANAAACVADKAPDKYAEYVDTLFANQPAEGGAGLSDDKLKSLASDIGADINSCVDDKTFRPYVKYSTELASNIGITGTPTIFVDGKQWDGSHRPERRDPGGHRSEGLRPLSVQRPASGFSGSGLLLKGRSRLLPGRGPGSRPASLPFLPPAALGLRLSGAVRRRPQGTPP